MRKALFTVLSSLFLFSCYTEEFQGETAQTATQFETKSLTITSGSDIQAALDAINDDGGGTLTLQKGTYTLTEPLVIYSNITLQGDASLAPSDVTIGLSNTNFNDAIITNQINGNHFDIENVTLKNFKVRGNLADSEQHYPPEYHTNGTISNGSYRNNMIGIFFNADGDDYASAKNKNITIQDVEVRNCSMGIHLKGTRDLLLNNVKIHKNGMVEAFYHNVYFRRCFSATVVNSDFYDSTTGNGMNVSQSTDINMINNNFYNNFFRGLRIEGEGGFKVTAIFVDGNYCYGNGDRQFRFANTIGGTIKNNIGYPNDLYTSGLSNVTFTNNNFNVDPRTVTRGDIDFSTTKKIAFYSNQVNKYVAAENLGNDGLVANRDAIGSWEEFEQFDNGDGTVSFKAIINGKYLTAASTSAQVIANSNTLGTNQKFTIKTRTDGNIAIYANGVKRYINVAPRYDGKLYTKWSNLNGNWESFSIIAL